MFNRAVVRAVCAAGLVITAAVYAKPGDFYVSDVTEIHAFGRGGGDEPRATFTSSLSDSDYHGIVIAPDGLILVADYWKGNVDGYTKAGERVLRIDTRHPPGDPAANQMCPSALAFDENGVLYVAGPSGPLQRYSMKTFPYAYIDHINLPGALYAQQAIDVACDGSVLYYSPPEDGIVLRFDLRAMIPMPELAFAWDDLGSEIYSMKLSHRGLLVGGHGSVALYDTPSGVLRWATPDVDVGRCTALALSPTHPERFYAHFSNQRPGTPSLGTYVMGLETGPVRGGAGLPLMRLSFGLAVEGAPMPCAPGPRAGPPERGLEPACRVDLSGDGVVDFGDYLEFLNYFDAGC